MIRRLAAVAVLAALASCSKDEGTPAPAPLTLTPAGSTTLPADGTSSLTIAVSGSTHPPISVSTTRGRFSNGLQTISLAGNGDVVLQSCDSAVTPSCAGSATVTASDAGYATGRLTVTFTAAEVCTVAGDEDGDGQADCADSDCAAQACTLAGGGSGTCQGGSCVAATCTPSTEICDSGADEDCDGASDCADADCTGQQCSASDPSLTCSGGACVDASSGLGLQIATGRTRMPADGVSTTPVTVTATSAGAPAAGTTVSLSTDLGSVAPASAVTDADGVASFTFTASATAGEATLTAGVAGPPALTLTARIVMPALGSIQVASIQNPVMGVRTSGFNEQNLVEVLLLDTEQMPYPDGLQVEFRHLPLGGSRISTPWTDGAGCTAPACQRFLGATASPSGAPDTAGIAEVRLESGTAAGLVAIRVSASAGGVSRTFTVQNIAIVGAKASGAHVSLFCTPLNVPALVYDDCTNSFYGGEAQPITCTAYLADRFNNVLGRSTLVEFRSEAGSAGPPLLTAQYDPAKGGDQTADLGFAENTVLVTGYPIPRDVAPLGGEFSATFDAGCGSAQHNPRDGLGTVMAAAQGEEGFVDWNGNGVYDAGEPFVDSGEPFVDENDDGVRSGDELFIDVDQSGAWNGPNGVWDSDTVVWAEARVVYTGLPWQVRWLDPAEAGLLPGPTRTPVRFAVFGSTPGPASSQPWDVWYTDRNYNRLSSLATFDVTALYGNVTADFLVTPGLVDSLGMAFTQQYCDAAPPAAPTACYGTCRSSPCYRVPRVGSYSYGNLAAVLITGGTAGTDTVWSTATLEGITVGGTIAGDCN